MASSNRTARRSGLIGAALFFAFGLIMLFEAYRADVRHTIIPGGGDKAAWMYPWQGYAAALFCFVAVAYALSRAFRKRSDEKADS
jgi:hypothetical protein